ncbi:DNA-3-methyladenine glycosylase [Sediminibacillus dalangtanensis]|uniref:Putative 3-methyladenine DNA glycosylase n=1 Tax=Sediminibacillus dalangtanensis TaxID=2729421 RepID=A0ABX7VQE6_9BACI|nr:DNA-3-methyladenine glycosylase [Sediminibacillus dalangtanensis]QTM97990.1 DNA-3-methyladenine glycosylase [Sediminibacillus dalangtanensis]
MSTEQEIFSPLPLDFYDQPTLQLAPALLGCLLVKETSEGTASGIIVETEAYKGPFDQAAHSFKSRRTKRTEIMFGTSGSTYTYVMHTHCLMNVVSGGVDVPEAVLIRAVEPYSGLSLIHSRRPKAKNERQLTNGPGKLCKALGISMEDYGHRLDQPPLWIASGPDRDKFVTKAGPRVGIDNTGEAKFYPWRFWIQDNRFVSR